MKKKVLLCFIDDIKSKDEFDKFIKRFDDNQFEVHILNGIVENNIQPHDVIHIIETIFMDKLENHSYYFLSNIEEFLILVYRIYHQVFQQFIFFANDQIHYNVHLEKIYNELLRHEFTIDESIIKPIYINDSFYKEKFNKLIKDFCVPLTNFEDLSKSIHVKPIQKLYFFNNNYYLFEPTSGEEVIISLKGTKNKEKISYFNTKIYSKNLSINDALQLINQLHESKNSYLRSFKFFRDYFESLKNFIVSSNYFTKNFYIKSFELLSRSFDIYVEIFILSFLVNILPNSKYYNRIHSVLLESHKIGKYEKYFYLYQCIRLGFVNQDLWDYQTAILQRKLYRDIYYSFRKEIKNRYKFIPKEERDKNFIVVLTSQFLNLNHAPTKTALDRCYSLITHLGKKVMLINTKELLTSKGFSPFHNVIIGNEVKELENYRNIKYKDIEIPFYQTSYQMPDMDEIINIMEFIEKRKPYFVLQIGGGSINSDLCSQIVPVVTISTVFSGLPLSEGNMYVIGRKVNENDVKLLKEFDFNKEKVIESVFTFDFKPQQRKYTKTQLNLPKNKFLIAIVGTRLDEEITETFIKLLTEMIKQLNIHIVFIGEFKKYTDFVRANNYLKKNSTCLGFQEDVLAILELCDLYVNPKRTGGGSSVAEAMFKGLPVVTLNSGDVFIAAGSDFGVDSYEEMKQMIVKYVKNKDFYSEMSKKALQRAQLLLSTHEQMKDIFCKIEKNRYFK
ncbi:glycosyltransferase [Bacillus sp. FSL W8-1127]|uniref:glycosyltransferase n=1 Tax=Bacillus sp. FSL W8-1127 TaxID=2954710 RepID=UPI0030F8EA7C